MAEGFLDQLLNFIMPIVVWGFVIWVIYRIPIFKEMVHAVGGKVRTFREKRQESNNYSYGTKIQTIDYE